MLYFCCGGDFIKTFCFTVDDNIRFLKEITEQEYKSIFEHPYLAMYKRLHQEFDLKVQLNLFYRMQGFDLSQMSGRYYSEFKENSDWLKLSFHSEYENVKPYENAGYDVLYNDCKAVNDEIIRFASPASLAKTTTVHYCLTTKRGVDALSNNGVKGLLGLYGDADNPMTSYSLDSIDASRVRNGETVCIDGMHFARIDVVLNLYSEPEIIKLLSNLLHRDSVRLMIHEQYFYPDYTAYQPDFENKLRSVFAFLRNDGYKSVLFEEVI